LGFLLAVQAKPALTTGSVDDLKYWILFNPRS
jgi:hypothetical protein